MENNTSFTESLNQLMGPLQVQTPVVEKVEKKNILFDILNALFINKDIINNLTTESARQNIFMINRRLAIKYPIQAQLFNINNLNAKNVITSWSDFLYCGFVPKWIYTPGIAKTKSNVKNLLQQESLIKRFRNFYNIEKRDMETCIRLFPNETEEELKFFVKLEKESFKDEETNN